MGCNESKHGVATGNNTKCQLLRRKFEAGKSKKADMSQKKQSKAHEKSLQKSETRSTEKGLEGQKSPADVKEITINKEPDDAEEAEGPKKVAPQEPPKVTVALEDLSKVAPDSPNEYFSPKKADDVGKDAGGEEVVECHAPTPLEAALETKADVTGNEKSSSKVIEHNVVVKNEAGEEKSVEGGGGGEKVNNKDATNPQEAKVKVEAANVELTSQYQDNFVGETSKFQMNILRQKGGHEESSTNRQVIKQESIVKDQETNSQQKKESSTKDEEINKQQVKESSAKDQVNDKQ